MAGVELAGLPELTPVTAAPGGELAARWAAAGWEIDEAVATTSDQPGAPGSSWARRLASTAPEPLLVLRAHAL